MDNLIILEYSHEQASFHFNYVRNGVPRSKPDSHGWNSIALTNEDKATAFCRIIEAKNHRRRSCNMGQLTAEHVKKEWKSFCYVFNYIVVYCHVSEEDKAGIEAAFDSATALARLGHGSFADEKEDMDLPYAWEYDSLDYIDSNF